MTITNKLAITVLISFGILYLLTPEDISVVEENVPVVEGLTWTSKRIICPVTLFDKSVTAEYHFENTQEFPIRLDKIRPLCNCLEVVCDDREISPGEKGIISVKFTFLQRYGRNVKRVRVVASDGTIDTLSIVADIPQVFEMTPVKVPWNVGDDLVAKSMRLKAPEGKKIYLKNAIADHSHFTSSLKEIIPGVEYEVTAKPIDTSRQAYALVWCETDIINPVDGKPKKIDLRFYVH